MSDTDCLSNKEWDQYCGLNKNGEPWVEPDDCWDPPKQIIPSKEMKFPDRGKTVLMEVPDDSLEKWASYFSMPMKDVLTDLKRWKTRKDQMDAATQARAVELHQPSGKRPKKKLRQMSDDEIKAKYQRLNYEIRKKEWIIKYNPLLILGHAVSEVDSIMVRSLKKVPMEDPPQDIIDDPEHDCCYYIGHVWIKPDRLLEMEMDYNWVKERLTQSARDRMSAETFKVLRPDDRLDDLKFKQFCKVKWTVKYVILKNANGYGLSVPTQWAEENLDNVLIARAKLKAHTSGSFVFLYASSAANGHSRPAMVPDSLKVPSKPIPYFNESGQCIALSFAHALHHLGYKDAADYVVSESSEFHFDGHPREACKALAKDFLRPQGIQVYYGGSKNGKKKYGNFLGGSNVFPPVIAKIKATNGHTEEETQHVVCFVENLVLDSNVDFAMIVSQASMDFISNLVCGSPYMGVFWSREVIVVDPRKMPAKNK